MCETAHTLNYIGRIIWSAARSGISVSKPGRPTIRPYDMESTERRAIWRNQEHDEPVTVTHELGEEAGKWYFAVAESVAGIPEDELVFVEPE